MIYRRSFYYEALNNAAVLVAILGGIFLLVWFGLLLTEQIAFSGVVSFNLVLLKTASIMPQLLTVALFSGTVTTFSRMVQSAEYTAWAFAGLRERHWQLCVLLLALPMAVTVGMLALHGAPWTIRFAEDYQRQAIGETRLEDNVPGLFSELPDQNLIFYFDALNPDYRSALGIFIVRQPQENVMHLLSARRADTEINANGLRSLRMQQGLFTALDFSRSSGSHINFNSAQLDLSKRQDHQQYRLRSRPLSELSADAAGQVEYWWRVSFPLCLLLLCLMALPLGQLSPGTGRSYQMLLATLCYWLYYTFAGLAKAYGLQGTITPLTAGLGPLLLLVLPLTGYYAYRLVRR